MIEKKQEEIIEKIDNLDIIKRFKELEIRIINNQEYNRIKNEFDNNKNKYEKGILESN